MNKIIAGGCSFTYGHELSDDVAGKVPSQKAWAALLSEGMDYICTAQGGLGNTGIARRVFTEVSKHRAEDIGVAVMWTFTSRYDWAMPRHRLLDQTRWASISPWDTSKYDDEVYQALQGSETQMELWAKRNQTAQETGVKSFAENLYKYGANDYHETYLSWKSIIWLQNILEKKNIPYFFTLADNTLFYNDFDEKRKQDFLMDALYKEINFTNWFSFGERMMGFNQWAFLNDYPRASTHPLDSAHQDAVKLMTTSFKKIIGVKK